MLKKGLKKLIIERVLSEPSIVHKYTGGRCSTPSGKFEKQLGNSVQRHALTKMLMLVIFLDTAKRNKVLSDDPCLFVESSSAKSSREVLITICRECMGGEGRTIKHLEHFGIHVSHVQKPLDEYEFAIDNLAIDLKDGVRLSKMVEILTNESNILSAMRLPAKSWDQKIRNVGISLTALKLMGVPNITDVTAAHIVDSHRPRIIQLLWATISHFQLSAVIESSVIEHEINKILSSRKARCNSLWKQCIEKLNQGEKQEANERIPSLLLIWCQVICSFYDVSVKNFATSFADGKVFCLLVHFYHPLLLRHQEILPTTVDLQTSLEDGAKPADDLYKEAIQNEHRNILLAESNISQLGGVPELFSDRDLFHPPEEKSVILCISYLFSRLTETREEVISTVSIQTWYRRCHRQAILKRRISAASLIFYEWKQRKNSYFQNQAKKYAKPVSVIESSYSAYRERRERHISAICLQVSSNISCAFSTKDTFILFRVFHNSNLSIILKPTELLQNCSCNQSI